MDPDIVFDIAPEDVPGILQEALPEMPGEVLDEYLAELMSETDSEPTGYLPELRPEESSGTMSDMMSGFSYETMFDYTQITESLTQIADKLPEPMEFGHAFGVIAGLILVVIWAVTFKI